MHISRDTVISAQLETSYDDLHYRTDYWHRLQRPQAGISAAQNVPTTRHRSLKADNRVPTWMHRGLHVEHSGCRLALCVPGGPSLCCQPLICGTTCHLQGQGRLKGNVKWSFPLRLDVQYESLMTPLWFWQLPAKGAPLYKCYALITGSC